MHHQTSFDTAGNCVTIKALVVERQAESFDHHDTTKRRSDESRGQVGIILADDSSGFDDVKGTGHVVRSYWRVVYSWNMPYPA